MEQNKSKGTRNSQTFIITSSTDQWDHQKCSLKRVHRYETWAHFCFCCRSLLCFCLLCRGFLPKSFSFGFNAGGDWFSDNISSKRFKRFPVFYYLSVETLGLKWKPSKNTSVVVCMRRGMNDQLKSIKHQFNFRCPFLPYYWPMCSLVRFEWLTFELAILPH